MTMTRTYAEVSYPPPEVTGPPCPTCNGAGVTGEQYEMATGADPVLLVDVFCPTCDGCGSADPKHAACNPAAHANADAEDYLDALEDDLDSEEAERCPSCWGRQWNPVQGFGDFNGKGDPERMVTLRVPCGCTTERTQLIER
jgi:hypothetical protein